MEFHMRQHNLKVDRRTGSTEPLMSNASATSWTVEFPSNLDDMSRQMIRPTR